MMRMTTLLVGLKEFRANLTDLTKRIKDGQTRLIVLSQNKPILEVRSIEPGTEFILEDYIPQISLARQQIKEGKVYSPDEVRKKLQL